MGKMNGVKKAANFGRRTVLSENIDLTFNEKVEFFIILS